MLVDLCAVFWGTAAAGWGGGAVHTRIVNERKRFDENVLRNCYSIL